MSCRKVQFLIQLCQDGEASAAEREAVDAHVAQCGACARVQADSRQLAQLLGGLPERRVSGQFESNLLAAVRETQPAPPAAAWWERFRLRFEWRLRVPALVAAGSLACGLVAAVVMPRMAELQEAQQERKEFMVTAVERHRQLEKEAATGDLEALDASVELSTGSILTE
jgi:anti-sigma factor RsiW